MEGKIGGKNLILCCELIKEKILKHSDKLIAQYCVPELREETEHLWNELQPEVNTTIDAEFDKLMVDLNSIENVTKLIQLRLKYGKEGPPAWTYSGTASEDVKVLNNITSQTMEPDFNQLVVKGEEISKDLYSCYKTLKENIAELDRQISEQSAEMTMEYETILNEIVCKES